MPRLLLVTAADTERCDHLGDAAESVAALAGAAAAIGVEIVWSVCFDGAAVPTVNTDLGTGPSDRPHTALLVPQLPGVETHLWGLDGRWGPSVARNVAFAAADADWVFPLDADDVLIADGMLAMCAELAAGAAWVASSRIELDGRTSPAVVPERLELAAGEVNATYLHPYMFHPNNVAYRSDVLADAGGWPALPGGEDLALLLRVARTHPGIAVPDTSIGYRRWDAQVTATGAFSTARAARYRVYSRFDLLAGRDPDQMRATSPSSATHPASPPVAHP